MANVVKKKGKKYNIFDKINNVWNQCSLWTHADDVEFDDGKSATTKLSAINGITSDLSGEAEDIAASIKCVNQLNCSLTNFLQLDEIYNNQTLSIPQDGNSHIIDVNLLETIQKYKFVICVLSINGSDNYNCCYLGKPRANGITFEGGNGGTYYRQDEITINTKITIICRSYYTHHTINGILLYGVK